VSKRIANLGALCLILAILLAMALPVVVGTTPDLPAHLVSDPTKLRARLEHQTAQESRRGAAYLSLGFLAGAGVALLGTGLLLGRADRPAARED
jgi:hypothetical protein